MNVATATLCVNCDTIFEYSSACPACGAVQQLVPVSHWLPAIHKPILHKKTRQKQSKFALYATVFFIGVVGEAAWVLSMLR